MLLLVRCDTKTSKIARPEFSIEVRHFARAAGLTIYYIVNGESIQVDTDCDFENCSRETVYKRKLNSSQSRKLLEDLRSLRLDTLRKNYGPKRMVFDGLASSVKIHGSELLDQEISIDNADIPTIDSLYRVIDKLILTKKYQFYSFGQE